MSFLWNMMTQKETQKKAQNQSVTLSHATDAKIKIKSNKKVKKNAKQRKEKELKQKNEERIKKENAQKNGQEICLCGELMNLQTVTKCNYGIYPQSDKVTICDDCERKLDKIEMVWQCIEFKNKHPVLCINCKEIRNLNDRKNKAKQINNESQGIIDKLSKVKRELKTKTNEISELRKEKTIKQKLSLNKMVRKEEKLNEVIQTLKKQKEKQYTAQQTKINELKTSLNKITRTLDKQNDKMQLKLDEINVLKHEKIQFEQQQLQHTTQRKKMNTLELSLNKMATKEEKLNEVIQKLKTQKEKQYTAQQTQINELQISLNNVTQELDQQNEHIQLKSGEINVLKQETIQFKQQHTTQQKRIIELETLLNKMDEKQRLKQEAEEKNSTKEEGMRKILSNLKEEIKIIKQKYNKQNLDELMKTQPKQLIQQNSKLNVEINSNDKSMDKMILILKSLNKYMNDIKSYIKQISIPNVKDYKNWNLEQMMLWIISLDDGKFVDQQQILKNGFAKSGIIVGEVLPELTRSDLSSPPFNINNFMIKKQLVKHFKSLQNQPNNNVEEEGIETAFV